MSFEPKTLPSIPLLREEKVPFELELIGSIFFIAWYLTTPQKDWNCELTHHPIVMWGGHDIKPKLKSQNKNLASQIA